MKQLTKIRHTYRQIFTGHQRPYRKIHFLCFLLCLSLTLLTGCKNQEADLVPDEQTQNELAAENAHLSFTALTNQIFLQEITSDSITLHYTLASPQALSIPAITPTLGTAGEQERLASIEKVTSYLEELKTISYEALSEDDRITYDILSWEFETIADGKDFSYFSESISPTIGIQAQLPILLAEYEFRHSKDIEDYILLLRDLPNYYQKLLDYEKEKAAAGLFMAPATVDNVTSQCRDFLCDVNEHFLTTTFNQKIDALSWLSDEQKNQFKELNLSTLTDYVYPAYESLIEGLTALKETNTNAEGLCHYPNGKEYYAYLVKMSTGSESTPEALIARTNEQMQKDMLAMSGLLSENPALLQEVQSLSISYTKPEEILEHLKKTIQQDFPTPPAVDYSVKYVDASLQNHLSPAFYLTPPIDDLMQNVIYINEPSFHDSVQLFTTLAHEGYPGHLYQNICFESYAPDKVRSLLSFPGYAEGYATYSEMFSYQYMGLEEQVSELLRLSSSVTLGLYASLDLGIHNQGWSIDEAKALLARYGITDEIVVKQIYEAIVAEPANYLKYYVGYLEFLSLRDTAKARWGKNYSDKQFHRYILQIGDAPFSVLEKHLPKKASD